MSDARFRWRQDTFPRLLQSDFSFITSIIIILLSEVYFA